MIAGSVLTGSRSSRSHHSLNAWTRRMLDGSSSTRALESWRVSAATNDRQRASVVAKAHAVIASSCESK